MDIKTLLTCLFVINLFMGFYTYLIKKTQPTFAGINYWIVSTFFISSGYLLLTQRDHMPDFLTIVMCQMLFFSAGLLRVFGLFKFFDKKPKNSYRILTIVSLVAYFLLLYYFTYIIKSIFVRTFFIGLTISFLCVILGLQILMNRPSRRNYTYIFTSLIFFAFSAIFLARITIWIFFPEVRGLFVASFVNDLQFISSMVIDIAWTTMFFVIHNQRLTRQLQESEEEFRTLFTQNSAAMALIRFDTSVELVNDAYCQMSGYTKEEVTGMSWTSHIPADDLDRLKEYNNLRILNSEAAPTKYEFRFYKKNGEERHGLMSVSLIPSSRKIIASFTDITERKASEIQLQKYASELDHLNNGKDRFLSILAHDLRGPFSSLINLSELLLLNFKNEDKEVAERQLLLMLQTARRTYQLLEDLLLWSTSNMGKLPFNQGRVDISGVYKSVTEDLASQANTKNITIQSAGLEDIVLNADYNMVKIILRNLVNNAIKFCNENGKIIVVATKEQFFVTINVTDDGIGISAENQQKLWDITQTYTTYGTAREKGTGLGLLLCKELVEKHGGKIWVESQPDKGSSFMFTLPLFVE
jgi:PAS domain S-box